MRNCIYIVLFGFNSYNFFFFFFFFFLNVKVARHYLSDREDFDRTARYWTVTYAPKKSYDGPADEVGLDKNAIATLCEMGFDRISVLSALRATQNDLEAALQKLLG